MILYLGSSRDKVYPRLVQELEDSGHPFVVVDEDHASRYEVRCEGGRWRIHGDGCTGDRPVGSIFVRHAVARTMDPEVVVPMNRLQVSLNRLMLMSPCPVINRPSKAYSN